MNLTRVIRATHRTQAIRQVTIPDDLCANSLATSGGERRSRI